MLPLLKSWRLNELRFPREFGPDSLHYGGRVPGHRKLTIQLCWRPEDRRFCAQVFGLATRQSKTGGVGVFFIGFTNVPGRDRILYLSGKA